MFFDGYADKGRCAAGGHHLAQGSGFDFALPYGYQEQPTAQIAWRYCRNCHGLFYEGFAGNSSVSKGRCPAGGDHVSEGYKFALPHHLDSVNVAYAQNGWRFCRECHSMFYNGYGKKGWCPAGAARGTGKPGQAAKAVDHVAWGWDFILPHDLPDTLEYEVSIKLPGPLKGKSHFTLRQDGSYLFTGNYKDYGASQYNINSAWVFKDAQNIVYGYTTVQNRRKSSGPCCKRGLCVPENGILRLRSAVLS
jgi:hypothetical protein